MANESECDVAVNIDESVQRRLCSSDQSWGIFLGGLEKDNFDIASVINCQNIDIRNPATVKSIHYHHEAANHDVPCAIEQEINQIMVSIPTGFGIVGIYYFLDEIKEPLCRLAKHILVPQIPKVLNGETEKVIVCKVTKDGHFEVEFLNCCNDPDVENEKTVFSVHVGKTVATDFLDKKLHFRLRCSLPCQLNLTDIDASIFQEQNRVLSKLADNEILLTSKGENRKLIKNNTSLDIKFSDFFKTDIIAQRNGLIDLDMMLSMSSNRSRDSEAVSPILMFNSSVDEVLKFDLTMDIIIMVDKSEQVESLIHLALEGLSVQAKGLLFAMKRYKEKFDFCQLKAFHFHPHNLCHYITLIYPVKSLNGSDIPEEKLLDLRKSYHNSFILPTDRPLFKTIQNCYEATNLGFLINPHQGLRSGIEGGICAVVKGKYAYHHYMQDRFDDNGWGCAYRSLQTLCSWFRLQGYTKRSVPSHKEVQDVLVSVGDKPKNLSGSRQWIGSFEVGICLQELINVQSKILHVATGAEMACKGRELIEHFEEQGTPVMIGGGVLAHTILGVHFNESTGQIRFLILDPHYTGHEDLKTVTSKGWCGWKGPDFWDQVAHYNMCLPQRPIMI
ncbi:ufm1-specific protease 2-like [Rhopilema esculentum]|uniref:ufm1-specific protease 2-like n=1 Tax=Rhopilema esculentum TaxID=499914 RepID=UPI0031D74569|eukprot:gene5354-530_t